MFFPNRLLFIPPYANNARMIFDSSRIAIELGRLGLSTEQFARDIDVTLSTVNHWKAGLTEPRGANLLKIARRLGVDPEAFYIDESEAVA
jgi:transcriptional regulator with XRE-family HTH domain